MQGAVALLSSWAIPALIAIVLVHGRMRGVKVYESFLAGAEEGFSLSVRLIPFLVGIFVALAIFRESGAMALAVRGLRPVLGALGVPPEVVPLMVIRPLSGSGAIGAAAEIFKTHGPDSFVGRLASTVQGSTDTTFYVLAVYFGAVGVRRPRHAVAAGLIGDVAGFAAAVVVTRWFFGA